MATDAIAGYGTTLKRDGNVIAELTHISGPAKTADSIDVSSFSSPDSYREFIRGFKEGGDVGLEGNFIPGDTNGQAGLDTDFEAGTLQDFIITFINGATWTFTAVVTKGIETDVTFDGKVGFSATLKVSGKPILGVSYSSDMSALAFEDSIGAKTPVPAFSATVYTYSVTIDTASTYILVTATQATASIVAECLGVEHTLTSGVQSGQITVGAADSVTLLTIKITDSGKSPRVTNVYVIRP